MIIGYTLSQLVVTALFLNSKSAAILFCSYRQSDDWPGVLIFERLSDLALSRSCSIQMVFIIEIHVKI